MPRTIIAWWTAVFAVIPSLWAQTCVGGENLADAIRNTPLQVAGQTLARARTLSAQHRYREAVPLLWTAADALAFFEEREIGRFDGVGGEAEYTRQEILNYANVIRTDSHDALNNIDAWLNQVTRWSARRKVVWLGSGGATGCGKNPH